MCVSWWQVIPYGFCRLGIRLYAANVNLAIKIPQIDLQQLEDFKTILNIFEISCVSSDVGDYLKSCRYGTANRCLITARLVYVCTHVPVQSCK